MYMPIWACLIILNNMRLKYLIKILICSMAVFALSACRKSLQDENQVYGTDFEGNDFSNTSGVVINNYNGNRVSGFYNKGEFSVELNSLAKHDYLKVTFDLYIHDSWDGNNAGNFEVVAGPDIWSMIVDGEYIMNTSFSNTVCNVIYCLQQSYPKNFPMHFNPGSGAANNSLPGLCSPGSVTTLYRIEKLIRHDKSRVSITFSDLLKQSNVKNELCDESWSLDNLKISTLNSN